MMKVHFFFFSSRRRHTRFDCDWSSDVCSSDLRMMRDLLGFCSGLRDCCHLPFPLPHHAHERPAQLRIELDAFALLQIAECLLERPRLPVWPTRAQRVVHIADMHELARLMTVARVVQHRVSPPFNLVVS